MSDQAAKPPANKEASKEDAVKASEAEKAIKLQGTQAAVKDAADAPAAAAGDTESAPAAEAEAAAPPEDEEDPDDPAEEGGDAPGPAAEGSAPGKQRATRSRNPAFAAKQKNFIKDYKRSVGSAPSPSERKAGDEGKKKKKTDDPLAQGPPSAALNDNFCWVCHRDGRVICCETCPRVFHLKCAGLSSDPPGDWVCIECRRVVQAETVDNLSPSMKMLTHDQFTLLLKHAIGRLKGLPGAEPFITPVDEDKFPNYREFVACPMDLNTMEENINNGMYGSTEAFVADCKWIVHNCILFNGQTSKLTALAKSLLRMCKWEMEEIETCPDCYSNAYSSDNWFTLACPHPHVLIWARLKGFPYWPAKAVKSKDGNVDCRFFGRHDRAWVPIKECYLFSKDPPSPPKNRSKSLDACIEELEKHIKNLEQKFGKFVHAKPKTVYDPKKIGHFIKQMLPGYDCNIVRPDQEPAKRKRTTSEIQLDMLEKLRQGKKARRSVSATMQEARGEASAPRLEREDRDQPREQEDEDDPMEQDEDEEEATPAKTKNARKSLGRSKAPELEPEGAKEAAAPAPAPQPAAPPRVVAKPEPGSPAAVKTVQAMTVPTVASVSTPSAPPPGAAQAVQQRLVRVAAATRPHMVPVMHQSPGRPRLHQQHPVRTNGVPNQMRPRMMGAMRSPLGAGVPRAPLSRGSPAGRGYPGGAGGGEGSLVLSLPQTLGPLMVVPGGATGATGAGPAEGATAADAPPPPVHGTPASEELRKQANNLSELMRSGLEQALSELTQAGAPPAAIANLRTQIERLQWRHQMELSEQKKVTDTMLAELRNSMDIEQKKVVNKLTASFAAERGEWSRQTELKVAEAKKKQWCANCGREAIFYCCWNTSYCDFPCQEAQWPRHMMTCANQQSSQPAEGEGEGAPEGEMQEQEVA